MKCGVDPPDSRSMVIVSDACARSSHLPGTADNSKDLGLNVDNFLDRECHVPRACDDSQYVGGK